MCVSKNPSCTGFMDDPLGERWRVQVGGLLGLDQLAVQFLRRYHEAQAQAWDQHLGERAHVDDMFRCHRQQAGQVSPL